MVSLELSPAPVVSFALRKLTRLAGVQCSQHADPGVQQEVAAFRSLDQAMNGRLPFGPLLVGLRQLRSVVGSIFQRDEGSSPRKRIGSSNGVD